MLPNIDNNFGIKAVEKALNSRDTNFPSTECVLEAVEICLNSNHSTFKDINYLQIHDTAMVPKNACSYADLAMGIVDHKATNQAEKLSLFYGQIPR